MFRTRLAVEVSIRDCFVIPAGSMVRVKYLGYRRWEVRYGDLKFNASEYMVQILKNGEV